MPKILLIEDEPLLLQLFEKKLKLEGFEVEIAQRGQTGLEKAKSFQPDLILLDILMPGMDGFEVMKRLKADPATKKIPVVFLTNLSRDEGDVSKGLEMGAIGYWVKAHYTPMEVVTKLKKLVKAYSPGEKTPKAKPT